MVAFEPPNPIDKVDHLIRVEQNEDNEVLGLVVLFGHIAILVSLGRTGTNVGAHTYRVDPLNEIDRNDDPADLDWPIPIWRQNATMDTDQKALQTQLQKLVPLVEEIQRSNWLHSVVGPHIEAWFEEERAAGGLTDERRHELIDKMSSALIYELMPSIVAASKRRRNQARSEQTDRNVDED